MATILRESWVRWAYRIAVLAFTAVILYLLALNFTKYRRIDSLQDALSEKKQQLAEAQRKGSEMRSRQEFMQTDEFIEQEAHEHLGFVYPNEILFESSTAIN